MNRNQYMDIGLAGATMGEYCNEAWKAKEERWKLVESLGAEVEHVLDDLR
jgi:hypothetical protein